MIFIWYQKKSDAPLLMRLAGRIRSSQNQRKILHVEGHSKLADNNTDTQKNKQYIQKYGSQFTHIHQRVQAIKFHAVKETPGRQGEAG